MGRTNIDMGNFRYRLCCENVEPMGYKAMLVAVDREACALYKEALDRYFPPEYSEVVISHGHNDPPLLAAYHYTEEEGFAAYWFLRGRGIDRAEEIGRRMGSAFAAYPYWRTDPKQEQQVRTALYKALLAGGIKAGSKGMVDEILTNLRRAS
jgi:hypothetical protein